MHVAQSVSASRGAHPAPPPKQDLNQLLLRNQAESPFFRLPPEIRKSIYEHVFSHASVRAIRNPSGSIPRYIVVKEGTPALLVCRQMNQEAARYEYSHTTLTVPDTVYFPELVYVIQKSCSNAVQTLEMTFGMASDLRTRMIDDRHRQLEAAWQSQETTKEVLSGLKSVNIIMGLTELDFTRNITSIKKALQDKKGLLTALRRALCNRELQLCGLLKYWYHE